MSVVLDASALLAYLQREAGADIVKAALGEAVISAVNWAEVVQKATAAADEVEALRADIQSLGLVIQPFSTIQAEIAGTLRKSERALPPSAYPWRTGLVSHWASTPRVRSTRPIAFGVISTWMMLTSKLSGESGEQDSVWLR